MNQLLEPRSLDSFTGVRSLRFEQDPFDDTYDIELTLFDEQNPNRTLTLKLRDVSDFSISDFGGGRTQVLCLRVIKLNAGHDRKNYIVEELERKSLVVTCREVDAV